MVLWLAALSFCAQEPGDWPSFRGPRASGVAPAGATPTAWDVPGSKNVLWKTPLPGLSHSSPIVWGGRVYITTAVSGKENPELRVGLYGDVTPVEDDSVHRWKVLCLDGATGRLLWERTAHEGVPKIKRHTKATHANSTMATDGKRVVACFGSEGLYAYDLDGKLLWKKDLGVLDSGWFASPAAQWGFASSPVLHEDRILLQCDVQKNSFIAAFDAGDGREIWRTARDEVPTWSTPTVHGTQVVVNGYRHIGGYDLKTGKEIWRMKGGGDIPVPTPVVAHDLIFIASAHGAMAPLYAVRTGAAGDITLQENATSNDHVAWSEPRNGAYMQTPLVWGDLLYSCRDNGVLNCYEARTGRRLYQERLGSGGRMGFTASPVAADGKIYFTRERGEVDVVQAGPEFKLLATNSLGENCLATPAISAGVLFFRTQGHLIAVGGK